MLAKFPPIGAEGQKKMAVALLDSQPAVKKRIPEKLKKQKSALVLVRRWSPRTRGCLPQRVDAKTMSLFADGVRAGVQFETER